MSRFLTDIKVKGARSVQHGIDARCLGHLVKRPRLSNVRHDDHLELAVRGLSRVGVTDLLGLSLGADGGDDGVVLFEELVEDVGCVMN
jgi:hypothetical protein